MSVGSSRSSEVLQEDPGGRVRERRRSEVAQKTREPIRTGPELEAQSQQFRENVLGDRRGRSFVVAAGGVLTLLLFLMFQLLC